MQDEPTPTELLNAVAEFLRNDIAPKISGAAGFKLRVATNAIDLVVRQLELSEPRAANELTRLVTLLGENGSLADLNRKLANSIATGAVDLNTPGLADHLWQSTMDKLAVDQPNYASYRRELEREKNS